jgi:hypothetical protein
MNEEAGASGQCVPGLEPRNEGCRISLHSVRPTKSKIANRKSKIAPPHAHDSLQP